MVMWTTNTRRYLDVDSDVFERYGRQMDVTTMLCSQLLETVPIFWKDRASNTQTVAYPPQVII